MTKSTMNPIHISTAERGGNNYTGIKYIIIIIMIDGSDVVMRILTLVPAINDDASVAKNVSRFSKYAIL